MSGCPYVIRFSKKVKNSALIVSMTVIVASTAFADQQPIPSGTYEGGGRVCHGELIISDKSLSWKTTFSHCKNVPYIYARSALPQGTTSHHFHLQQQQTGCLNTDIVLLEKPQTGPEPAWEILGYPATRDWESGNTAAALSCMVVQTKP